MKRVISCLLCIFLLCSLSACALLQKLDGPGTVYEDPAAQNGNALTGETDQPQPVATEPIPQQTLPSGLTVRTDYSQYAPRDAGPTPSFTRLSEQPLLGLRAGNHGKIYPFAADALYSNYEGGYSYQNGYHYGFVTASGQIVCDPYYTEAFPVRVYAYWSGQNDVLPLWVVGRTDEVEVHDEGEYTWLDGITRYAVAAMDGSFVTPMEYRSITGYDHGFIGTRDWETSDFDVYDLQGRRLFGSRELEEALPGFGNCSLSYSEGVFVLSGYDDDTGTSWNYALDEQGKVLFGPLRALECFSEGLASASADGDSYGFVDKQGNWVIPARYDYGDYFLNGRATVRIDGRPMLIDPQGNVLLARDTGWLNHSGDYYAWYSEDNGMTLYDRDGGLVFRGEPDEEWNVLTGSILFRIEDGNGILCDLSTNRELTVPDVDYFYTPMMYEAMDNTAQTFYYQGKPCVVGSRWHEGTDGQYGYTTSTVVSLELEVLASELRSSFGVTSDQLTGENYATLYESNSNYAKYYRTDGTLLGSYGVGGLRIMDGLVQYTDDSAAWLYDNSGTALFCYPLLALLDD